MIRKRLPFLLVAVGLLGVVFYQRLIPAGAPAFMHADYFRGFVVGVCIGLELVGCTLLIKRRRCGGSC